MKLYIYLLTICCVSILYGECRRYPEPPRQAALHVYEPLKEKRYTLEEDGSGKVYICEQALFNTQGFLTIPSIYCVPAQELIIKNTDYIPYEAKAWFNGHNLVMCKHQNGELSGFYGTRSCREDPPGDAIVIGQTEQAYIIKDKGEVVCNA